MLEKIKIFAILGVAARILCASSANAAVYSAADSGNWTNAATWSPGGPPLVADQAVVASEHTVTLATSVELGPHNDAMLIGDWGGSNGHLVLDGASAALIVRGNFLMGQNGTSNTIAINGGSLSVDWSCRIGRWGHGTDTVTLNGGTLFAGALDMAITADTHPENLGHLQINRGNVTVGTGGLALGPGGSIDIASEGQLTFLARNVTDISEVEDSGSITADGGRGVFIYEYRSDLNSTTITAAPPLAEIPIISVDQLAGTNGLALTWNTQPDGEYMILSKTNLLDADWAVHRADIPGGNSGSVTVTTAVDRSALFCCVGISGTTQTSVIVPNVVGLARAFAETNIVAAGLVVGTEMDGYNDSGSAGDVIRQNPAGNSFVASGSPVDLVISIDDEMLFERSVVNTGDLSRVRAVLAKAERVEDIIIGTIGGSITMGALATEPEYRWANRVAQWFSDRYPNIAVEFYNAGIGSTGSKFGALRAYKHLLQYEPDLVVVEYSINDSANEIPGKTLEGLLRQILKTDKQPALIKLAMMNAWGDNVQDKHIPLILHYDLPMVSFRDVFGPIIKAGNMTPDQVLADSVHPNNTGHEIAAYLVTSMLEEATRGSGFSAGILPAPLYTDRFERVRFFEAVDLAPLVSTGWILGDHIPTLDSPWRIMDGRRIIEKVWHASAPASQFEFEYEGTFLALTFWRENADMGVARVFIDGEEQPVLNGWAEWAFAATTVCGEGLPFGTHQVRIEISSETAPESNGHEFDLIAIAYGEGTNTL